MSDTDVTLGSQTPRLHEQKLPEFAMSKLYPSPVLEISMTALKALAILEATVLECKKRDINTLEVRDALNFLEPQTKPPWLILQYRNALDSDRTTDVGREGQ